MMRTTGMLLAAGALVALGFRGGDAPGAVEQRAPVRVSVSVTNCERDTVTFTVSPWQARVGPDDDLAWTQSGTDSVAIRPLTSGWPFPTANPRAARGALASAGRLARGRAQEGQVFSYEIIVYCGDRVLRIDPDIIIGPE